MESADSSWTRLARPSVFWTATAGVALTALWTARDPDLTDLLGFFLVTGAAMGPAFLWCRGRSVGPPIYPLFAIGGIWTFALPLISHHPVVIAYPASDRFVAALTVALTLTLGTLVWILCTVRESLLRASYLAVRNDLARPLFFTAIVAAIAFHLCLVPLAAALDPSVFSLLRAVVLGLANLALFALGHACGGGNLRRSLAVLYIALVVTLVLATLPSVLLINGLSFGGLALLGFGLGRGRLPWIALLLLVGATLFLQAGKSALRDKYWFDGDATVLEADRYPALLTDWIGLSWNAVWTQSDPALPTAIPLDNDEAAQPLIERASLLHLLLRIQKMTPAEVPYLNGETYSIIPGLLVPRVFNAAKARSHQGTYLLATHYDLQRPDDTASTTIGFGLINEAFANFGFTGCLALGAFLGGFYGWIARMSAAYPILSLRGLVAILVLTVSFQNEFTAGVYVTTLFQGACGVLLFAILTVRRASTPIPDDETEPRDMELSSPFSETS